MDELADTHLQEEPDGYRLLTELSALGWSAGIIAAEDDSGDIVVIVHRLGSKPIREQGASVAQVAPSICRRARAA